MKISDYTSVINFNYFNNATPRLKPTQLFGRDGRCVQSLIHHSP